jgi:hypothetical protein
LLNKEIFHGLGQVEISVEKNFLYQLELYLIYIVTYSMTSFISDVVGCAPDGWPLSASESETVLVEVVPVACNKSCLVVVVDVACVVAVALRRAHTALEAETVPVEVVLVACNVVAVVHVACVVAVALLRARFAVDKAVELAGAAVDLEDFKTVQVWAISLSCGNLTAAVALSGPMRVRFLLAS